MGLTAALKEILYVLTTPKALQMNINQKYDNGYKMYWYDFRFISQSIVFKLGESFILC